MKKFDDIQSIYERPAGYTGETNGTPDSNKLQDAIGFDDTVSPAYKVPWEKNGHLSSADDDCYDAVWGIQDGRRYVRQLKTIPEK